MDSTFKENNLPSLLRIEDLTKFFGVSRQTIYNWIRGGILKSVKIGRLVYFKVDDVKKLLNIFDNNTGFIKKFGARN